MTELQGKGDLLKPSRNASNNWVVSTLREKQKENKEKENLQKGKNESTRDKNNLKNNLKKNI